MFTRPESITMQLGGIGDADARRRAEQVLRQTKGVRSATVDEHAVAAVTYRADQTTVDAIAGNLAAAGYSII
ncbi:MAG: hypothetical protein IKA63_03800 [Clostridia bacterium]|nr:hypothetical protein [Clostridia bacterium]